MTPIATFSMMALAGIGVLGCVSDDLPLTPNGTGTSGSGGASGSTTSSASGGASGSTTSSASGGGGTGGAPLCDEDETDCSGTCANLMVDGANCGACGHDCLGGDCEAGSCLPVAIATMQDRPFALAVDGAHVYWALDNYTQPDGGGLVQSAHDGSSFETVLGPGTLAFNLAIDATHAYWPLRGLTSDVFKAPLEGGAITTLATGESYPTAVAVDGTSVYWTSYFGSAIRKVALQGGTAETLASGQSNAAYLALGGGRVVWSTEVETTGTIMSVPIGGGSTTTIATNQNRPHWVATDGADVYWTTSVGGTVMAAPIGGGAATTLATGEVAPYALIIDGTHAYWVRDNGQTIARIPLGGGTVTTVASGLTNVAFLAEHLGALYWTEATEVTGNVWRMAKPL